jgi:hypothetical protein
VSVASKLIATTIDCPEPRKLAAFYQALTGWETTFEDEEYAAVAPKGDRYPGIGFQRVEPYTAPSWPDQAHPQQLHLDFYADADLDTAEAAPFVLGPPSPDPHPRPDRWRVMLDPAGHPFCLCAS